MPFESGARGDEIESCAGMLWDDGEPPPGAKAKCASTGGAVRFAAQPESTAAKCASSSVTGKDK